MDSIRRVGTHFQHDRDWPIYQRPVFTIEVIGSIPADQVSAEALRTEIAEVLDKYGVEVRVKPANRCFVRPEDEAEIQRLNQQAIARGY